MVSLENLSNASVLFYDVFFPQRSYPFSLRTILHYLRYLYTFMRKDLRPSCLGSDQTFFEPDLELFFLFLLFEFVSFGVKAEVEADLEEEAAAFF